MQSPVFAAKKDSEQVWTRMLRHGTFRNFRCRIAIVYRVPIKTQNTDPSEQGICCFVDEIRYVHNCHWSENISGSKIEIE
jgi:hypothetical protein